MNGMSMIANGADGTGTVDCATILSNVLAALPSGGMIVFDAGYTFKLSTCLMDGKPVTICADGATINCTSSSGALRKTDHGNTLKIRGGQWVATSTAICIKYAAAASSNTYVDMEVSGSKFSSQSGYCVSLVGCRETTWSQCEFTSSAAGGVYLNEANNPYFDQSVFIGQGAGIGFFMDGKGSPNSCNPILNACELMGWGTNVIICGADDFHIENCTIDYGVNHNTVIASQDAGSIIGGYLGGGVNGVSNNPALEIVSAGPLSYGPDACRLISVIGVNFANHQFTGNLMDQMLIGGFVWDVTASGNTPAPTNSAYFPAYINVDNCHFYGYTRYGINFSTIGQLNITNNTFFNATGSEPTVSPIRNATTTGDSLVLITGNQFPNPTTLSGSGLASANVINNPGFFSGAGANSIVSQRNGYTGIGGFGSSYWHWINQTGPVRLDRYGAPATMRFRRSSGIYPTPTTSASGDVAGSCTFDIYNGSGYYPIATMQAEADGTPGTNTPGRLMFYTAASAGGTPGNIFPGLGIYSSGDVVIDPASNNATAGFTFRSNSASRVGVFSGTAAPTITCGDGSLYLRGGATPGLYFRTGGAWVAVTIP